MLFRGHEPFTVGASRYLDAHPERGPEGTAKIFVRLSPEGLNADLLAQLDTAAAWTVVDRDVAAVMGLLDAEGLGTRLSARGGSYEGKLVKLPITLVADEGSELRIDATVFVSEHWQNGTFIGYGGLLQHIRFAIDPENNLFYFGPPDARGIIPEGSKR